MSSDRTKHKILPPSKFGLIQITRQRVRPEMNIKTKEPNPNINGEVEAPIVLLDKINADLNKIVKHAKHRKKKIHLHVHPFIAAYLNQGIFSIRMNWWWEHKKWVTIVPVMLTNTYTIVLVIKTIKRYVRKNQAAFL